MIGPKSTTPARRIAEASQPFENILSHEFDALFSTTPTKQQANPSPAQFEPDDFWIAGDDIIDLQRLAEFLYEASVKDSYYSYHINVGTDGPRLTLRAKIWNALPDDLQSRLEIVATRPKYVWEKDASYTAELLARGLTLLIRGKPITDEIMMPQSPSQPRASL